MFKILEQQKSPEVEKQTETKIILEFMRHGKKETDKNKPETDISLTDEGRDMAFKRGKELSPQVEVSLARASQYRRAKETVAHIMLAEQENIDPNATLEELEATIAKEIKIGKKIIEDKRLGYEYGPEAAQDATKAVKEGRYFPYIIEESDKLAIKRGDKISSTYTRYAGNIAEIIDRYSRIGTNFNRIASQTEKYKKFGNQLERYMGNHMGSVESFMAKVLEKMYGEDKRDELIKSVGGGFKELHGIHIEIINKGDNQKILIIYDINNQNETLEINNELLKDIIRERSEFEKLINSKNF
jgi:hypothetical protein